MDEADTVSVINNRTGAKKRPYNKCDHCGMYSASEGKCPFCPTGMLRHG